MSPSPTLRAASLGCVPPVLQGPPSPLPPSLFPRGAEENKTGLQGMARNMMSPSPKGGACQEPQAGHKMKDLASMCKAGSGTPQGGAP